MKQKSINAGIAQLGERQTEDLKVACSIHAHRNFVHVHQVSYFLLFHNLSQLVQISHL